MDGLTVKWRFDRIQTAIGRQEMAKRGIVSVVTADEIEADAYLHDDFSTC